MLTPEIIAAAQGSHKTFWPRGPFVSISLAQYALESGWGRFPSGENNFFGIKATQEQIAAGHYTMRTTHEQRANGAVYIVQAAFANYPTLQDGFEAHAALLISSRYEACENAQSVEAYAYALKTCGYATDVSYPQKLLAIVNGFSLMKYDQVFKG